VNAFELKPITKLHLGSGAGGHGDAEGLDDVELAAAYVYDQLRRFAETCFENFENASKFELPPLDRLMTDLGMLGEEDIVQMLRLVSVKRYDRPRPYRAVNACFLMSAWAFGLKLPRGVVNELSGLALLHPLSLSETGEPKLVQSTVDREEILGKLARLEKIWPITELQLLGLLEWGNPYGDNGIYELEGTKGYLHFFGRMLRIVADFEMMTTVEGKRRVYLPDEALTAMLNAKGIYDPTLLKLFVNWMGVYPLGSLVLLQTGELAQVFAGASDPTKFQRPVVCILKDAQGNLLERPELYDLTEMNEKLGTYRKTIRRSISIDEAQIPPDRFKLTPVGI
jgi:hypothetical protein